MLALLVNTAIAANVPCIFSESKSGYTCNLVSDHEDVEDIDMSDRMHLTGRADKDVKHLQLKFKPTSIDLRLIFEKFENLEMVELWKNSIKGLNLSCFGSKLQTFDFRMNELSTLTTDAFSSCKTIRKLILIKNQINSVSETTFDYLIDLEVLDLSFNGIVTLSRYQFKKCLHLKVLKLAYNKLSNFIRTENLKSVKLFDVSFNGIQSMEFQTLSWLTRLEELYLNGNKFFELRQAITSLSPKLKILNLADNQLNILNMTQKPLKSLQYLDISNNKITKIGIDLKVAEHLMYFHARGNVCIDASFETIENFDDEVAPLLRRC